MALPTSFEYEAQISGLEGRQGALAGLYNLARRRRALQAAAEAASGGYADDADTTMTQDAGNEAYGLNLRGEGNQYRDAMRSVMAAYGRGNTLGSSFHLADRERAQREVALRRAAFLQSYQDQQAGTVDDQTREATGLQGQLGQARGGYADWRAQQTAYAAPAPAPTPPPEVGTAPSPVTRPQAPRPVAPRPPVRRVAPNLSTPQRRVL